MESAIWFGLALFFGLIYIFVPSNFFLSLALAGLYTSFFAALGVKGMLTGALVYLILSGVFVLGIKILFKNNVKDDEEVYPS